MTSELQGSMDGQGLRIGIVVSCFNDFITSKLLGGALETLDQHGVPSKDVTIARVPGGFEVPLIAQEMAKTGRHDAIICLGAVIRGETGHYDHVAWEAARGVAEVSRSSGIPVLFGVLTTETVEQAHERSGGKHGNAGSSCAAGAIEMANLLRQVRSEESG